MSEKDVFDFGLEDTIWDEVNEQQPVSPKETAEKEVFNEPEISKEPEVFKEPKVSKETESPIIDVKEEEQKKVIDELEIEVEKKKKPVFWILFAILLVLILGGFIALLFGVRKNMRNNGEEFTIAQIFQDISDKVTDIFNKPSSDDDIPPVIDEPELPNEGDDSIEEPIEEPIDDSDEDLPEEEIKDGEEEIEEKVIEEETKIDYSEAGNSTFKNVTLADGTTISGLNMVNFINANPGKTCKVYSSFNSEECIYQGGISVSDVNVNANYRVTIVGNDIIFNEE